MRILFLASPSGVQGPVPKIAPILVGALRELGHEVTVSPWGRHRDREGLAAKLTGRFQDLRRVRRSLRDEPFDVLVINTAHDWNTLIRDIALLLAVRGRRVPAILQFHGSAPNRLGLLPSWSPFRLATVVLMRLVDGALVLSGEEKDQWQAVFPGGRFEVVKNPSVALPQVDSHHKSAGETVFLFVGRLMPGKGMFETLEAFSRVRAHGPAHLVIAGDGPAAEEVRSKVRALGLESAVTLSGYLGPEKLAQAYADADVFVLPTYLTEGFPTAIQEAMQAGLPIITTPIRGAAHHLREGKQALFVPPRDPEALAERMERLRADPALRRRMGEACREKLQEFSPRTVAREYLEAIRRILAPRADGTSL